MMTRVAIVLLILAVAAPVMAFPVDIHYGTRAFSVTAPAYEFRFDLSRPRISEFGRVKGVMDLYLKSQGKTYRSSASAVPARVHPIRIGRYLTEVHVENIVLAASDGSVWPGLGEVTFYCHPDRVYVRAALVCNDQEWVAGELAAYQACEGHRDCPDTEVSSAGMGFSPKGGELNLLFPANADASVHSAGDIPMDAGTWQKGSRHEVSFIMYPGSRADAEKALQEELNPLPASVFEMTRGKVMGYDCRKGVYVMRAQDSPSGEPGPATYGGCTYTVKNDNNPRRILIEQFNDWGAIRGAVVRDGDGNPLPIHPQICANFPELGPHGEPDWGFVLYPLDLQPGEARSIMADHLYHDYGKNDQIMLMSLENVGDPILMQTSVGVCESHTMTTGLYFNNPADPHNDLRINDFRLYKGDYGGYRSVGLALPSFFRYCDSAGKWHKVVPEHTDVAFEGPVFVDYTSTGRTDDGKVQVTVRTVQTPHSDLTRIFSYVSIEFLQDVSVNPSRKSNIRFAQQYTFNPMVFRKYTYTANDGSVRTGELDLSGEIKEDGTPLGDKPFICAYHAPNGLENNIPCSDITGNPGFVLLDWKARINGKDIQPGLYIFSARGLGDHGGDYSRDLAVCPTEQLTKIKAGTKIEYAVENIVFGDVKSGYAIPARERVAFGLKPPSVGGQASSMPVMVKAVGGKAEFTLTGGINKIAVRVDGFPSAKPISLYERIGEQYIPVSQGVHGNDWYQCHADGKGGYGFIFLARPGRTYRVMQ